MSQKIIYIALATLIHGVSGKGTTQYNAGDAVPVEGKEAEDLVASGHIVDKDTYDARAKQRADAQAAKAKAADEVRAVNAQVHFDAAAAEQREFSKDEMPSGKVAAKAADEPAKK